MKYTMDDFIKEKIAVKVNPGNINLFLDMCEKKGLLWADGKKATDHLPDNALYILYGYPVYPKKSLAYASDSVGVRSLERHHFKKIDFEEIASNNRYQIIIDCYGDTTTARMVINGKEVKTAQAKRNPADKFNWKLAADLAFGRLWGDKKAEKTEPKVKEVKRDAKVGEYIRIVDAWKPDGYKNNDILRVCYTDFDNDIYVHVPGRFNHAFVAKREYTVLEGYKPSK